MVEGKQVKDRIPIKFGPGPFLEIDRMTFGLLQISGTRDLPTKVIMALNEQGFTGPGEVTVTIYTDRSFSISPGSTASGAVEFEVNVVANDGIQQSGVQERHAELRPR